ncbi:unnamed protein product, partial [Arabidopsis halleri]
MCLILPPKNKNTYLLIIKNYQSKKLTPFSFIAINFEMKTS